MRTPNKLAVTFSSIINCCFSLFYYSFFFLLSSIHSLRSTQSSGSGAITCTSLFSDFALRWCLLLEAVLFCTSFNFKRIEGGAVTCTFDLNLLTFLPILSCPPDGTPPFTLMVETPGFIMIGKLDANLDMTASPFGTTHWASASPPVQ